MNEQKKYENTKHEEKNISSKEAVEEAVSKEESKDELQLLKEENTKLKDSFLRAYAEAENTKKRCQQEIEKNSKFAISEFAKELLGVADNLQRAMTSAKNSDNEQCKALLQGVEMTQKELTKVFAKFGIKKIDCLDTVFDPNLERVVQEIEDKEKPAGTVIAELQSAYTINDRILREAMVVVTKGGKKA
ncbi:MAG: nucleotide exchange factor GrpE [Alphaproteobacteria bacterium]|nr:nucleotide exchange factor GrpE [Alphaproteobacteria bacterium]